MKKVRLIAVILCFVLISNFTVGIIDKIVALEIIDLDEHYWNLDASSLHTYSTNTSYQQANPQITVFTHGCGGSKAHWSNNASYNFAKG